MKSITSEKPRDYVKMHYYINKKENRNQVAHITYKYTIPMKKNKNMRFVSNSTLNPKLPFYLLTNGTHSRPYRK